MKIKIGYYLLVLMVFNACQKMKNEQDDEETSFKLYGRIEGIDSGKLNFKDSVYPIKNGAFEIEGKLSSPELIYLNVNDSLFMEVFASPDEITITADVHETERNHLLTTIDGSSVHEEYVEFKKGLTESPQLQYLEKVYARMQKLPKDSPELADMENVVNEARDAAAAFRNTYVKNYALSHPESYVAAYYMKFQTEIIGENIKDLELIVNGFSKEVKRSSYHKDLVKSLNLQKKVAVGKPAPDFTLKTPDGSDFSLSDLEGEKYVLIDFWASWCVPCRESFPHMKELYDTYKHAGLEILGVSNDSKHDAWKKAIVDDGLPWLQVVDEFPPRDAGPPYTARVITEYAAPYLPYSILIDKQGLIIARNLHGEKLDQKLEELFAE
ncbi:TlpA disulfide reductase family protein [Robertkochia solimangrovi]|uniref:TlpA disulfide reductase family protein n=1 Tax=Robertkochia solimangrovi TaxID=2213046 RepID=UPI0013A5A1D5|nr:TlpA disulfide reductase family protein [Robertkochia solimangrovi]